MKGRRVVITACSAITPIGHGRAAILDRLRRGVSGVKPLKEDNLLAKFIHSQVFGTVDDPIAYDFKRTYRKTMGADRVCPARSRRCWNRPTCRPFVTSDGSGVAFRLHPRSPGAARDLQDLFQRNRAGFSSIGAVDYLKSMVPRRR